MKQVLTLTVALILSSSTLLFAQSGGQHKTEKKQDIKHDMKDLKQDKKDLKKDQTDLTTDKTALAKDKKEKQEAVENKNPKAAKKEQAEINKDKKDITKDKKDIKKVSFLLHSKFGIVTATAAVQLRGKIKTVFKRPSI